MILQKLKCWNSQNKKDMFFNKKLRFQYSRTYWWKLYILGKRWNWLLKYYEMLELNIAAYQIESWVYTTRDSNFLQGMKRVEKTSYICWILMWIWTTTDENVNQTTCLHPAKIVRYQWGTLLENTVEAFPVTFTDMYETVWWLSY